jgi:hypothetical protein
MASIGVQRIRGFVRDRKRLAMASSATPLTNSSISLIRLNLSVEPGNNTSEAAFVVTVTVAVAAVVPLSVTVAGEMLQPAPVGAPLQVSVTVGLNPPLAANESMYVAVCPGATVADTADPENQCSSQFIERSLPARRLAPSGPPIYLDYY